MYSISDPIIEKKRSSVISYKKKSIPPLVNYKQKRMENNCDTIHPKHLVIFSFLTKIGVNYIAIGVVEDFNFLDLEIEKALKDTQNCPILKVFLK